MESCNPTNPVNNSIFNKAVQVVDKTASAGMASQRADTANASRDALLLTESLRAAYNAPDVRADKVAAIKAKLDNGTYKVDAAAIAFALISEEKALLSLQ